MSYIYGAPCKARNLNVVYIYGPTFGNAESRLFLFAAQCFNIESMQKMVQQPGLFSPKFGATSSHVSTQSPQKVAVGPGIHSLACWDRCFALPQLLYWWQHQSGIYWIPLVCCLSHILALQKSCIASVDVIFISQKKCLGPLLQRKKGRIVQRWEEWQHLSGH
jgi:hypothetical protein